jgi:hypothetical protein
MEWVRNTLRSLSRTDTQRLIEHSVHATDLENVQDAEAKWKEIFDRLDKNGDGVLCKEEFRRFCLLLLVVDSRFFKEKVWRPVHASIAF